MPNLNPGIVIPKASLQNITPANLVANVSVVPTGIKISFRYDITIPSAQIKGSTFDPAVDFPADPTGLNHVYVDGGLNPTILAALDLVDPTPGSSPIDVKTVFRLFSGKTRWGVGPRRRGRNLSLTSDKNLVAANGSKKNGVKKNAGKKKPYKKPVD
jgi:hypothetical protein